MQMITHDTQVYIYEHSITMKQMKQRKIKKKKCETEIAIENLK